MIHKKADISGYTSFVAQTEIEHADIALSCLLETIVGKLSNLLTISKLEGDAIFAYVEANKLAEGKSMLELIDQTYLAFRDQAEDLYSRATCPCRACQSIPTLDLKFLVHHGDFIVQHVTGIKDLLGTDVNLIHRLSKNHVSESTGWNICKQTKRLLSNRPNPMNISETWKHTSWICMSVMRE